MSKQSKLGKTTVELGTGEARPSRIRREPPPQEKADAGKIVPWRTSEREIWLAMIGIVAFALAINIITLAISAYWA